MKTKSIITSIYVICAMVLASCSADGDVLSEMGNQNIPTANEVLANVTCTINGIATKTGAENKEAVQNAMFFLIKGETILGCAQQGESIATKQQAGLKVVAVANAALVTYAALENLVNVNDIYTQVLNASDLESLIKVSQPTDVVFSDAPEVTVNVTVAQVAARIDLATLTVKKVLAADTKTVTLESVELLNQNTEGVMNGSAVNPGQYLGVRSETLNSLITDGNSIQDVCHFYTFANDNVASLTTIRLNLLVDGISLQRDFTIKHRETENSANYKECVMAGCNYKLNVALIVKGENVEPEVTFTVADWNKSQVSGNMTEISK